MFARSCKQSQKGFVCNRLYTSEFWNLQVKVLCNMLNTLFKPILTYSQEICFMDSYILLIFQGHAQVKISNVDLLSFVD